MDGASRVNKPVSVCGEIASDPIYVGLLLGMGADSLSLTPSMLPEIKYLVRNMEMASARALVDEVLALNDSEAVVQRLEAFRDQVVAQ